MIKKEKNGLLALILIFSILDVVGELIVQEQPKYLFLCITAAGMIVIYFVIKYIKHKTSLLYEDGR